MFHITLRIAFEKLDSSARMRSVARDCGHNSTISTADAIDFRNNRQKTLTSKPKPKTTVRQ